MTKNLYMGNGRVYHLLSQARQRVLQLIEIFSNTGKPVDTEEYKKLQRLSYDQLVGLLVTEGD